MALVQMLHTSGDCNGGPLEVEPSRGGLLAELLLTCNRLGTDRPERDDYGKLYKYKSTYLLTMKQR